MSSVEEVKLIIKSILCTYPGGKAPLSELSKQYVNQEGTKLETIAKRFNFSHVFSLISSWKNEFEVSGHGSFSFVQVKELDHIAEMNKHSKKSGNKKRFQGFSNYIYRPHTGKDPYEFSDDSNDSYLFDEEANLNKFVEMYVAPNPTQETTQASAVQLSEFAETSIESKTATSSEKIIPSCRSLNISEPISIRFLDGINPHRFWFAEISDYKLLNDLMHDIQKFYRKNTKLEIKTKDVKRGLYVAAKYSDLWHRCFIIEVFSNGIVRILCVDFGTVTDVSVNKIRYLTEKFFDVPCIAQRGTLSHVQPNNDSWGKSCLKYFNSKLAAKAIEAKIFKKNMSDMSYQMAMKADLEDDGEMVLVTKALIKKNWCLYDPEFTNKQLVNATEMSFSEYEFGKHLKKPVEKMSSRDDDWLPITEESWLPMVENKTNEKKSIDKKDTSFSNPRKVSTIKTEKSNSCLQKSIENKDSWVPKATKKMSVEIANVKEDEPQRDTSIKMIDISLSNSSSGTEKTIGSVKSGSSQGRSKLLTPAIARKTIVEQSMKRLPVGSIQDIYVHVVHDICNFFFFLKTEFTEINIFLNKFNDAYFKFNVLPFCDDFTIGNNVVTFANENFCRGQILKELEDDSLEIFLIDFGIIVERTKDGVHKLFDEWKVRQACIYKGKLENIPEHFHLKSRDQLAKRVGTKFVEVKVLNIQKNVVSLLLINP